MKVFDDKYKFGQWREKGGSLSGPGSDLAETEAVRDRLMPLLRDHGIGSLLDIGCGDWNWMRLVVPGCGIVYHGCDCVASVIEQNQLHYGMAGIEFSVANLISDTPPAEFEAALARDVFVHLSFADAASMLANLRRAGIRYLLATTYTSRTVNTDIETGRWRPINMALAPYNLGEPIDIIFERSKWHDRNGNSYPDRTLGMWRL